MRRWRWLLVGALGSVIVLCALSLSMLIATNSRMIRTRYDAVAFHLEERGIAYHDLQLVDILGAIDGYHSFPNEVRPYAVSLTMQDGGVVQGWLTCQGTHGPCDLTLAAAEIRNQRIPNLSEIREAPWAEWIERISERLQAR